MKLIELQGIKQVVSTSTSNRYSDILTSHGFKRLGYGDYADVYENPKLPYVLKIYSNNDKGYSAFLELIKNHRNNPHLPNLIGQPIKLNSHVNAVRLEKLTPFDSSYEYFEEVCTLLSYADVPEWRTVIPNICDNVDKIREFIKKYPKFAKLMDILNAYRLQHHVNFDLHDGNIMLRGNVPVVTDPFC